VVGYGDDCDASMVPDSHRVSTSPCCPGGHHEKQTRGG
jgi:hypothetical protein